MTRPFAAGPTGKLRLIRVLSGRSKNRRARTFRITTEIGPRICAQHIRSRGVERRSSFLTLRDEDRGQGGVTLDTFLVFRTRPAALLGIMELFSSDSHAS
jgi:hypothetical protein